MRNNIIKLILAITLSTSAVYASDIEANPFEPIVLDENEIVFTQSTRKIDSVDPAYTASYYPGGRGPNKLVIYTPSYGYHTGTNEFGTEAIVEGNIVTSLTGADSAIPQNGIVISGHGMAKNWITQNIHAGSKVYIDRLSNNITTYTTSESYTFEAEEKIKEAKSIVDYYKVTLENYNYKLPEDHILKAQQYLKNAQDNPKNSTSLKQFSQQAIEEANMAIKTSLPYIKDELKGVWIRPTEKTPLQIIGTLDKLKDNGFNSVFLETYYHGKTIYPSQVMNKHGFIVQNEEFSEFDPLKIWISEAHKRGIKVHIWFQSFYVGNQPPENNPASILSVHPEWGNKTKLNANNIGATRSVSEHNGYFLDPANPEVQNFLEELIGEIITEYKPDGINLDYIRYPNANAKNDNSAWGFTEYARTNFQMQYGVDPVELSSSDILWYNWNEYRRNNVTNFVKRIGNLCREKKIYVSTVIFPDISSALSMKQQDWRTWSANDYVDGFTPLFLTYDSKMLSSMLNDVLKVKSENTDLYSGIFVTFMGGTSEDLIRQIYETRRKNTNGIILFDYAHTTPIYTNTLMASAFNSQKLNAERKIAHKKKSIPEKKREEKRPDKSKQKTIITTSPKGTWVFSK